MYWHSGGVGGVGTGAGAALGVDLCMDLFACVRASNGAYHTLAMQCCAKLASYFGLPVARPSHPTQHAQLAPLHLNAPKMSIPNLGLLYFQLVEQL